MSSSDSEKYKPKTEEKAIYKEIGCFYFPLDLRFHLELAKDWYSIIIESSFDGEFLAGNGDIDDAINQVEYMLETLKEAKEEIKRYQENAS